MNVIETSLVSKKEELLKRDVVFHQEQDSGGHSRPVGQWDNEGHCGHFIHVGH